MRAARLVLLLLLVVGLGGCASVSRMFGGGDEKKTEKPVDPASDTRPDGQRAAYRLEVSAPGALRKMMLDYLDLARFQNAPETDGINASELERLVAGVPAQARALLQTEGYFNAEVTVAKTEAPGEPPLFRIEVKPGPRTTVKATRIEAVGPLQDAAEAGDKAALNARAKLQSQWPLGPGKPFTQSDWAGAKTGSLARLRGDGYAAAIWQETSAKIDADANAADLLAITRSGPLFHLGPIRIEGLQRYPESGVRNLATFGAGTPYSEQLLLDYQERLQKTNLFEGASVELDPDPAKAESAPVTVRLREAPLQQATFGVGYSANTGPRLSAQHIYRNVFGTGWTADNKFAYGPQLKSWTGDLLSSPQPGANRNLVSMGYEDLRSTDQQRTTFSTRVGRRQDTKRIERLYYAEYTHVELQTAAGSSTNQAVSGNYNWIWKNVDNVLLPTRGVTLNLQGGLGYALSNVQKNGPFQRTYGRLTWYRPFGDSWYGTVRVEAGQVFAHLDVGVPDTILFRAGGDESVRGYGYRSLGPRVNNVVVGGHVLATTSLEVAHPIRADIPALLWATFIDAGNVSDTWGRLSPAVGYGVGLRYRSPVGPFKIDLAYGQKSQQLRVHLSVGVTF